jgi:hypothetical protein
MAAMGGCAGAAAAARSTVCRGANAWANGSHDCRQRTADQPRANGTTVFHLVILRAAPVRHFGVITAMVSPLARLAAGGKGTSIALQMTSY